MIIDGRDMISKAGTMTKVGALMCIVGMTPGVRDGFSIAGVGVRIVQEGLKVVSVGGKRLRDGLIMYAKMFF